MARRQAVRPERPSRRRAASATGAAISARASPITSGGASSAASTTRGGRAEGGGEGGHDLADWAGHSPILDRRVRRAGADADRAARPRNTGIARQVAQVGDGVGLRQAKIEQRPQRLRAGAWPPAGSEKL